MFITFEGIDGAGKSIAIESIKEFVQEKFPEKSIIITREPGGKNINEAERIRKLLLDNENYFDPMSEALLYLASRRIHLERVIWPNLKKGNIVISDRYYDSSFAYQGYAKEVGIDIIKKLNKIGTNNTNPDVTFFINTRPSEAYKRMNKQERSLDRLESEGLSFMEKAFEGYEILIKNEPERFITINGLQSKKEVIADIKEKFNAWLLKQNIKF